ncbi:hypothetical protein AFK68_16440 [Hydrocoleum sp. CS-953]|uniref:hypothetical protein n=1 Tax=Hydrocoleum sp. CS-953 TaxID=1671698 RepID=UPI000B9B9321|nr:hypothetical protein [Hydrocoleum sp. CS-953]OZH53619.1 hypothetical protein AFK68_16440 [Hydrocoleum sp. CS-953]
MKSTSLSVKENITFEEALALTQEIMSEMETDQLSAAKIEELIGDLVKRKDTARAFFAIYLRGPRPLVDNPSPSIIRALESSPETVTELLVKSLAMSSGMVVHHQRNQDQEAANESQTVRSRTKKLIKSVNIPGLSDNILELYQATTTGQGNYTDFLKRWGYDTEQLKAIEQAIEPLLN